MVSGGRQASPVKSVEDVNEDGLLDLILRFRSLELRLTPMADSDQARAILTGETWSGEPVQGEDMVRLR